MKNPWTTIAGSILIVLSGLTLYGVITKEQASQLGDYVPILIEVITGIIALFARDKGGGL